MGSTYIRDTAEDSECNTSPKIAAAQTQASAGHAASLDQTSAIKAANSKPGVGILSSKKAGPSTSLPDTSQDEVERTVTSNKTSTTATGQCTGWDHVMVSTEDLAKQTGVGLNVTIGATQSLWYDLKNDVDHAIEVGDRLVSEVSQITDSLKGATVDIYQFNENAQKLIDHLKKVMTRDRTNAGKINVGGVEVTLTSNMRRKLADHSMFQFLKMRGLDEDLSGEPFVDVDPNSLLRMIGSGIDSTTMDSTDSSSNKSKKRRVEGSSSKLTWEEQFIDMFKNRCRPDALNAPFTLRNHKCINKSLHAQINEHLPNHLRSSYPTLIASSEHTRDYKDFFRYVSGEEHTVLFVEAADGNFVVYIDASIPPIDRECSEWESVMKRSEPSKKSFVLFAPNDLAKAEFGSAMYDVYKYHPNPDNPSIYKRSISHPTIIDDVVVAIRLAGCFFGFHLGIDPNFQPNIVFYPNAKDNPFTCEKPRYQPPNGMKECDIYNWEMYSIDNTPRQTECSSNEYSTQAEARNAALEFLYNGLDVLPVSWRRNYDDFVDKSQLNLLKTNLNKGKGNSGPRSTFKKAFQTIQRFHSDAAEGVGRVLCNLTAQELGFCHQPQSKPIIVKVGMRSFMTRIDTLLVYHRSLLSTALHGICTVSKLSDEDFISASENRVVTVEGPDKTPQMLLDEVMTNQQFVHLVEKLSDGCRNLLKKHYDTIFTTDIVSCKKPEARLIVLLTKASDHMSSVEERNSILESMWTDVETISQILKKLNMIALNYSIDLTDMGITPEAFNTVLNHMRLIRLHKCGIGPRPNVLNMLHPDWNDDVCKVLSVLSIHPGLF